MDTEPADRISGAVVVLVMVVVVVVVVVVATVVVAVCGSHQAYLFHPSVIPVSVSIYR